MTRNFPDLSPPILGIMQYYMTMKIRQATSKGWVEVEPGMVFDGSFPTSTTRRGRLQGGGNICPTLTAGSNEIYVYEGVYDSEAGTRVV